MIAVAVYLTLRLVQAGSVAAFAVTVTAAHRTLSAVRRPAGMRCPLCGRPLSRGLLSPFPRPCSHGKGAA